MRTVLADPMEARADEHQPTTPTVTEPFATADAAPAPSPVSRPELPDVLALAFGQNAISNENGALTVDVTAFSFMALRRPELLDSPSEYQRASQWRRLGAAVTFGGKGLAFDSDGDGEVEAAKEAESALDIVSYEGRWQFWGSRDPLDATSLDQVVAEADTAAVESARTELLIQVAQEAEAGRLVLRRESNGDIRCVEGLQRFLESNEGRALVGKLRQSTSSIIGKIDEALKEIEHAPVWTAYFGGTERADGFGPDEQRAGIRGAFGTTGHSWVLNAGWKRFDGLAGAADPTTWTLGGEWIRPWKRLATPTKQPAQISASLSGERFEDVPDADFDEVVKVGVRLDYPIWENVVVPVSLTWANHASLLDEDDELVAHVGLSVDFKKLLKGKK